MQITRIKQNLITAQYNLSFDSSNSASSTIELFDEIPPEAEIYFNSDAQKLEIKGTDNTTVNPEISVISENEKQITYQIKDEVGNTTKLIFEGFKQGGKEEIKDELKAIQYNNNQIIEIKTDLKYEWSIDKDGAIKELEQRIEVKNSFDVKTKYNHQKNETKLKIKQQDQKEVEQTLPGLVIVKLTIKSGVLGFEY